MSKPEKSFAEVEAPVSSFFMDAPKSSSKTATPANSPKKKASPIERQAFENYEPKKMKRS